MTRPSEIQIQLYNYRTTYEYLEFSWTLEPEDAYDPNLISISADNSAFLIQPGALQFDTRYLLNVTISNSEAVGRDSTAT